MSRIISEPRLQRLLEKSMREAGRLAADKTIILRTPPVDVDTPGYAEPHSIDAFVFPNYFICERVETEGLMRRRRLVRWQHLDGNTAKRKYRLPDDSLVDVSPIRFVGGCPQGHIDDVDWRWVVYQGEDCSRPLFFEERGTSGAPADMAVVCECGRRITFQETNIPNRLGPCRGHRPWLGHDNRETCTSPLRILVRTATNTYFPQVVTVISFPQGDDELAKAIDGVWKYLEKIDSVEKLGFAVEIIPELAGALGKVSLDQAFAHIQARRAAEIAEANLSPRLAEFDLWLREGKNWHFRIGFTALRDYTRNLRSGNVLASSIYGSSETSSQFIGCVKSPASMASPGLSQLPHLRMMSRRCGWQSPVHPYPKPLTGCPQSSSSAKEFSFILSQLRLRLGSKIRR